MSKEKTCLASENWAPVHPLVIKALLEANEGYCPSYGSDPWTEEAEKLIQEAFKSDCKVFFVPTGTGANVYALKLACRSFQSIICTDIAHIQYQESGACEAILGAKLLTVTHSQGKLNPENVLKKLKSERAFGKHSTSPRVLSITQPTEVGTVYNLEELKQLSDLCKKENLLFHIDGSRIFNALASLHISFHELIEKINVDILSLGGTKNGLMGAEALVIFNSDLYEGSEHLQKQTLQLQSKMRYLSAQFTPFLKNDLGLKVASQANQRAKEIADLIKLTPQLSLSYPVETNQIFFTAPSSLLTLIQEKIICYSWDSERNEIRLITSWCTSEQDIANVKLALSEISINRIE